LFKARLVSLQTQNYATVCSLPPNTMSEERPSRINTKRSHIKYNNSTLYTMEV